MKLEERESESSPRNVSEVKGDTVSTAEPDMPSHPKNRPFFSSVRTSSTDQLSSPNSSMTAPSVSSKKSHAMAVSLGSTIQPKLLTSEPDASGAARTASKAITKKSTDSDVAQTSKMKSNLKKAAYLAPWKQDAEDRPHDASQSLLSDEIKTFSSSMSGHQYNAVTLSDASHVIQGDTVNLYNYLRPTIPDSLFSVFPAKELGDGGGQKAMYREGRQQSQLLRLAAAMPGTKNEPYFDVDNTLVRRTLRQIAKAFQFLDHGFAEYFRMSIADSREVRDQLGAIRETLYKRQHRDRPWIGALGEFCEQINTTPERSSVLFEIKDRGPDTLKYLQDALEVPYWNLVVDVFIERSEEYDASKNSIQVVRSVVKDVRYEIQLHKQNLEEDYPEQVPAEIMKGINARLDVLDKLLEWTPQPFDAAEKHKAQACYFSRMQILASIEPTTYQSAHNAAPPQPEPQLEANSEGATDLERVSSFTLLILFLVSSFIPAAIGFYGYYKIDDSSSAAFGSISDPDFYWLISGTLMATLGNLYSIVPLLQLTRGTETYWASWGFWFLSTTFGAASVGTYPVLNRCWSSSFSLFCSMFAIASVFVSTLATGNKAKKGGKIPSDEKLKTQ